MARTAWLVWLAAVGSLSTLGCNHFYESRAVTRFSEALEKKDVKAVNAATTDNFQRMALRHKKAIEDMEILNLTGGEINIVKVTEKSPGEKLVDVEVGRSKKELKYKLVRDKKTGSWLVDDVILTQRKRGATIPKPVTEQMDLLLTVREFLDAWDGGSRQEILDVSTTELSGVLKTLPANDLKQLSEHLTNKGHRGKAHRPKATIDGDVAVVTLARPAGDMTLVFHKKSAKWQVSDIAVKSHDNENHLPSLLKKAIVMRTANEFLAAYAAADFKSLGMVCTDKLYKDSLQYVRREDIAAMPLRPAGPYTTKFKLEGNRASLLLQGDRKVVSVTLLKNENQRDADAPTEYRVEDVGIYDLKSRQEVRIASYFTAKAVAQLFADGLAKRNLNLLDNTASSDFRQRVWSRIDSKILQSFPLLGLNREGFRIENTSYHGSVTEMQVKQGNVDAIYVLREQQGRVRVDDVLVLKFGQQHSLKEAAELAVPIHLFAKGIAVRDIPLLQRNSSDYMNRLVWSQTRSIPPSALNTPRFLGGEIASVERIKDERIVSIGSDDFGAKVKLITENGHYVIDDIRVIAGRNPEQQANLKHTMRMELATSGVLLPSAPTTPQDNNPAILPVRYEQPPAKLPYGLENPGMMPNGKQTTLRPDVSNYEKSPVRHAVATSYAPNSVDPNGVAFADFTPSIQQSPSNMMGKSTMGNSRLDRLENSSIDYDREFEAELARRRAAANSGMNNSTPQYGVPRQITPNDDMRPYKSRQESDRRYEKPMSYGTHPMMNLHQPQR